MKKIFVLCVLILSFLNLSAQEFENNLMPVPKSIEIGKGNFNIDKNFSIALKGSYHERLNRAATNALRRLDARTGMFFQQDFITDKTNPQSASVIINCEKPAEVKLGTDESYEMIIDSLSIRINSKTDIGAMYGLETLLQLLSVGDNGYFFPAVIIRDEPRFKWRGLMIDACRHFMPVDVIKRNLDAMLAVKMNVFHWHLSEDQGFRVESKVFPKLHELGSDGLFYSQDQIKDISEYANERGIRVIPEFDIPGHATSWFTAFPELASAPAPYKVERNWGIFDPTFNPADERTYTFFEKFLEEMSQLFSDEYFHIGGDENNGKQWNANESIQNFIKQNNIKDNHQLQAYFNNRILKILTKNGKKMIGWDEILHEDMPKNIVIQSWRGKESLLESAKKGYMGILSNGFYIDLVQPAEFHYKNEIIEDESQLLPEERELILGGEATMWAELITPETIDARIWPRTAAIAERFWSPKSVNDAEDMYRRLNRIEFLLEEHGLLHLKNYEMMLRRLTNNNDIEPLKKLVDIVEPVEFYQRHVQGVKYQQHSPYTRIPDAAKPESKKARLFAKQVSHYLEQRKEKCFGEVKKTLNEWKENHAYIIELIKISPILSEIEPLSSNLAEISQIGLEAIHMLDKGIKPDVKWLDKANSVIEMSKKPYAQVELKIVEPIEKLVKSL